MIRRKLKPGRIPSCSKLPNCETAYLFARESRHTGWKPNLFGRKEPLRMTTLGTIILAISLILGGSGITAVSAQGSLPDSALYPVKLLTEDIQFGLTIRSLRKVGIITAIERTAPDRDPHNAGKWHHSLRTRPSTFGDSFDANPPSGQQSGRTSGDQALVQTQTQLETQTRLMLQTQVATPQGQASNGSCSGDDPGTHPPGSNGSGEPAATPATAPAACTQQQLQDQQQNQQQYQTGTPSGTQFQYQTPQMPEKTKTPMGCSGPGQCGNNPN